MFTLTEIKYQLFRNRGRVVLLILVAAVLLGSMAFYLGNIETTRQAIAGLPEALPVAAHVTSTSGANITGITISQSSLEKFSAAAVHDLCYTADGTGFLEPESWEKRAMGYSGDTRVTGANCVEAVPGLKGESITFAAGYDGDFLQGTEALCILNGDFAQLHGLAVGEEISIPISNLSHGMMGDAQIPLWGASSDPSRLIPQVLKIVGTYPTAEGLVADMIVPVRWMQQTGAAAGVEIVYSSCGGILDDPLRLNDFKASMTTAFLSPQESSQDDYGGIALTLEDETFIKTVNELQDNLASFQRFLPTFFALVIGIATLVLFLALRSARHDIAIANSLGRTKLGSAGVYFLTILLTDLAGCAIALPLMVLGAGIGLLPALGILGLFLLCSAAGTVLALLFLLRFDPLELLTKVD